MDADFSAKRLQIADPLRKANSMLSETFQYLIAEGHLSRQELCDALGLKSDHSLHRYLHENQSPKADQIRRMLESFSKPAQLAILCAMIDGLPYLIESVADDASIYIDAPGGVGGVGVDPMRALIQVSHDCGLLLQHASDAKDSRNGRTLSLVQKQAAIALVDQLEERVAELRVGFQKVQTRKQARPLRSASSSMEGVAA